MQTHYYRPKSGKHACGTKPKRSATLSSTQYRDIFDAHRKSGIACERCCSAVDRMDSIAAKYEARKSAQ